MANNEDTPLVPPTNRWVGEAIGYSESGASLLRRGLRQPTLPLMRRVEGAFDWPVQDQVKADAAGTWASEFEQSVSLEFARENTTTKKENDK